MKPYAIVVTYDGKAPNKAVLSKIAEVFCNTCVEDGKNIHISILDAEDIAKSIVASSSARIIPVVEQSKEEKTPVEQALIYLSELFGKEVWRNPILLGIQLGQKQHTLSTESIVAIKILNENDVCDKLSIKYNYTKQHQTVIKAIASIL